MFGPTLGKGLRMDEIKLNWTAKKPIVVGWYFIKYKPGKGFKARANSAIMFDYVRDLTPGWNLDLLFAGPFRLNQCKVTK